MEIKMTVFVPLKHWMGSAIFGQCVECLCGIFTALNYVTSFNINAERG